MRLNEKIRENSRCIFFTDLWFHEISNNLINNIKHDLLIFSEYTRDIEVLPNFWSIQFGFMHFYPSSIMILL